jgi:hypothetical protein
MKIQYLIVFVLTACAARADFGYTMTRKAGAGTSGETKQYLKGQKLKTDTGGASIILDFDAQTLTNINDAQKTYTVQKFSDLGATLASTGTDVNASFKETGEHKTINGFRASQLVMTMDIENPQLKQQGMKMTMEMEFWISPDVPGAGEMRSFYQRNAAKFPWAAMSGSGATVNTGMQKAMADMQKKLATMNGVPVLQIVHMKTGGPAADRAAAAQNDPKMAQRRAQLEAMAAKGGPGADAAKQALARMGGASGGGGGMDVTMESSGFSTASIPDSVFAIPAGYTKVNK